MRLHESMLLVPIATLANFWATKFISLVLFEHEKTPTALGPCWSRAAPKPAAARVRASSHVAGRRTPLSRTNGSVSRDIGAY